MSSNEGSVVLISVGSTNQPSRVVGAAAEQDLGVGAAPRERDRVRQPAVRALVDHGAHEVAEVRDVAHADPPDLVGEQLEHAVPERCGNVGARGCRALLPLVLEGAPHQRRRDRCRLGRSVHDDEVLAARLADDARVGAVARDALPDLAPEPLEDLGRAREVEAGEVGMADARAGDRRRDRRARG